jgi:hypothetical protein
MKMLFHCLLLSFSLPVCAQNILTAENPEGKKYLLAHFGLKGKVMSVTEPNLNGKKILYFDNNGRLTMEKTEDSARTYFNQTFIYQYDSSNRFFKVTKDGTLPSTIYYTLDSKGNVTSVFQMSPSNKDIVYSYKNNLLETISYYEKDPAQGKIIAKQHFYKYNESGQVISEVYFDVLKKDTLTTKNYQYSVTEGTTLVFIDNATWMNVYRNKKTWIVKRYYDRNNTLLKEEEVAPTHIFTYEYKTDAAGNWVERNAHKRQITYRK